MGRIGEASSIKDILVAEAKAAEVFWRAVASLGVTFARPDSSRVPSHWLSVGERHSPLSRSPRGAVSPAQAVANYLAGLGEFAARLALVGLSLDPALGIFHKDAPRSSAALDLQEAVRGPLDGFALDLLTTRTFKAKDFSERPDGHVRLSTNLARQLAEVGLPLAEQQVAPVAEAVAHILAASAESKVTVRTRLTQADRKRGRQSAATRLRRLSPACRLCGVLLSDPERAICDQCLPAFDAERTEKLAAAGKATLAAMRASGRDPARTPEAMAKLAESSRESMKAIRAWEREHGKVIDREKYEHEILPLIKEMTVPALMAVTGLSQHYCWQVRSEKKRLHPMHWGRIVARDRR